MIKGGCRLLRSEAEIIDFAQKFNISFEYWDFKYPLFAVYWRMGDKAVIGLSKELKSYHTAARRCIIAEELGHHFTSAGPAINCSEACFHKRLVYARSEYQAQKWAAHFLLPLDRILNAYSFMGIRQLWEMAEFLDVTVEMLKFRLKLPDVYLNTYINRQYTGNMVKEGYNYGSLKYGT